ncbi:MAG: amidohydrolase family protein [Luteitalea sp.]|nr:amidohydrolase family protein [Luteitalea sp.]
MTARVDYFDCSAFVGRWAVPHTAAFYTAAELVRHMDYYGIDQALVWHAAGQAASPTIGNRLLMEEIAGHSRLHPVWGLLPEFFQTSETRRMILQSLQNHQVRAVRISPAPNHHHYSIRSWVCGPMFEALAERHIPLFMERDEVGWNDWAEVLQTWPALPVVLVNPGYRNERHLYPLLERYPQFYLEASTFVGHRRLEALMHRFGAGRLLFGTQMPVWDPGAILSVLAYADISDQDCRAIAGNNLVRLLEGSRYD